MKLNRLGRTDIYLPEICLGTMTFGQQNSQIEAFEQLDYALEHGLFFWDTAELYSVPARPETYGATETIIGNWFQQRGQRDKVFLASKIAGPGFSASHIRSGTTRFNQDHISEALDGSLKRLKTDYIDLYQLHWPERSTNFFGVLGFSNPSDSPDLTSFEETLYALQREIDRGRIRYIGLSNETPWGTMKFLQLAEKLGIDRFVSVQNPYNLVNRSFEIGMAEVSYQEDIGLLAYSPLAFGFLTGKYRNHAQPSNARFTLFPQLNQYVKPESLWAIDQYAELAERHGLTPVQLALAFIKHQFFVTSTIIGATTMDQLKENIHSFSIELSADILHGINKIYIQQPNPAP